METFSIFAVRREFSTSEILVGAPDFLLFLGLPWVPIFSVASSFGGRFFIYRNAVVWV